MIRILSPANSPDEVRALLEDGAEEFYCGVMPQSWRRNYTNMASPNRREWEVSNMTSFDTLAEAVAVAHGRGVPVYLTMNALYTDGQYEEVSGFVRRAHEIGIDAVIVADIGLLLKLREIGWRRDIHISTGGTAFNDEAVAFYRELGASRVILERQNRISEIAQIAEHNRDIEIEAFVLNRGCKNIDGFCTFHHGVNEVRIPLWWRLPKRLHFDYYILGLLKKLPAAVRDRVGSVSMLGADGACFLPYEIDVASATADERRKRTLWRTLRRNYNVFTGFDTCGICALWDLERAGVVSVKIVGRSNPIGKKRRDVRLLRQCLDYLRAEHPDRETFAGFARQAYRRVYGFTCERWCYFPAEDAALTAEEL